MCHTNKRYRYIYTIPVYLHATYLCGEQNSTKRNRLVPKLQNNKYYTTNGNGVFHFAGGEVPKLNEIWIMMLNLLKLSQQKVYNKYFLYINTFKR